MTFEQNDKPPLNEDLLEHFGVKGMHWGVRRERTPAQQLARAQKQIGKLDANRALEGYSLRGGAMKKMYAKESKKNPNFAYNKLSKADQEAWQKRASGKAARAVTLRGAAEAAVLVGGLNIAINHFNVSSKAKVGARIGTAILGLKMGQMVVHDLVDIHTANKMDRLRNQIDALEAKK